jgi:hypothetical protein
MASRGQGLLASASAIDLRALVEAAVVIAVTLVLLGWGFQRAITQSDGSVGFVPFTQSALGGGFDWTAHLYRFGVIGGSDMHDVGGSLPIVQLCSALGLSTTITVNLVTMFIQLGFAFFGIVAIEALVTRWSSAAFRLSRAQRVVAVWLCGFAPVLGWRLAVGHENLLLGVLPLYATIALLWAARAKTLSVTALVFAAFVVFNGVSGLGPQTLIYSAVFGAPLVLVTLFDAPKGERWGRLQWIVAGAIAAGVLVAVPRLVGMIHHAFGEDASRGFGESVVFSYGTSTGVDWLTSIPWTRRLAIGAAATLHERNFPIGPIVVFVVLRWPKGASRRVLGALAAGAVLAIILADDLAPLSTVLLHAIPPLQAFRVPARAILPIVVFLPSLALATCWFAREPPARDASRVHWIAIVLGAVAILTSRSVPPLVRESLAWLGCLAIVAAARWWPALFQRRTLIAAVAVIAALGVGAFDERFPHNAVFDPVEHGPRRLHDAVITQAPELAMPLDRVQIVDAPHPYDMSTAFAARLSSLDGVWYPPKRFLALLAALTGAPVPSTAVVFSLTRSPAFAVLQQLYNVRYIVSVAKGSIQAQPPTPGPAWFPARVVAIEDPSEMAAALRGVDLRAALTTTAWMLHADADRAPAFSGPCTAQVLQVTTDELGQAATILVDAPRACALIVSTNYVSTFRATASVGGILRDATVFPIDIALTGVAVPAGASLITLAPRPEIPWWSRAASLLGLVLLGTSISQLGRGARRPRPVAAAG